MASFLLIILIFSLATFVFNYDNKYNIRKKRAQSKLCSKDIISDDNNLIGPQHFTKEELRTIELIGISEYQAMNDRINTILQKHGMQKSISLRLTCGPDTKKGSNELHTLLPGHEIQMVVCWESGISYIDAYHNGSRIGRFALSESYAIHRIMRKGHLLGAYVAEQNCYEIESSQDLHIILFYETSDSPAIIKKFNQLRGQSDKLITDDFCNN